MENEVRVRRLLWLATFFLITTVLLTFRVIRLQVIRAPELARAALRQRSVGVDWGSRRGNFLDARGRLLTGRGRVWRGVFFPQTPGAVPETARFLISRLHVPSTWIAKTLQAGYPAKIPVEMTSGVRREIESAHPPGLVLAREPDRYGVPLAIHTIGYLAGTSGVSGLEYLFDDELSGRSGGRLTAVVDASHKPIPGIGYRVQPPEPGLAGEDVVLTIDRDLQQIVEGAVERSRIRGAVVAVDPQNGDVLTIASRPAFDPDHAARYLNADHAPFLNRGVLAFHPGSVFKIVVAAAALEDGVVTPSSRFFDPGYVDVGGTRFKCHLEGGHGELTFAGAMAESCNSILISVGQKLGAGSILSMAERLGFGHLTGVGLREEVAGGLPIKGQLTPADVANLSIGQKGVFATPLQVAMLGAAISNGGILYRPRIVKELRQSDGRVVRRFGVEKVGRVLRPSTAATLQGMLALTVKSGTGRAAAKVPGGAAGKTGTAETGRTGPDGRGINHAWFAGYAPLRDPQICLVVFAEEGDSGSQVAAPLFAEIVAAFLEGRK